jgi:hypothetical protein
MEWIVDVIWTAEEGITIDSFSFSDKTVTVWLLGGTVGMSYLVTAHITTAVKREDDRTMRIIIRNK